MIARIRRSDFLRHASIVFCGVVVANVFNYLYYMVAGRIGGVVVYGEITALASAMLVLAAPANVAQLIVAKMAADLEPAGDRAALRRLSDTVTRVAVIAGAAVMAIAFLCRVPIAAYFNIGESGPILAAALSLAAYLVTYTQRGVLQGSHLFADFSISLAIESVFRVVLGVLLIFRFGATGALLGNAIGMALAGIYNAVMFRRRFGPSEPSGALDRTVLASVVTGVGFGQLTLTVLTYYDVALAKHVFDARSAGLYAAAALVGRALMSAVSFIPILVLPKASARDAAGRSPLPVLGLSVAGASLVGVVAIALCFAAPAFIVTAIAGSAFHEAAPFVLLYVAASTALALANVVASYNFGRHQYAFVAPMSAVAVAEVATLLLWHPTLTSFVGVLAAGHACVLLSSFYRVTAARRVPADTGDPVGLVEPTVG